MTDTLLIRETKNGLSFDIHVNPHASQAQIAGIADGMLKIKVTAPPVEGAANDACIELLAKKLGLKKSRMKISAGAKGRKKTILVNDVSRTELEQKLRSLDLHSEA
ncbi:MAG TPA: DUF167 domain-containing protein [Smithellaceae bacterium]|nr:DUF167 domain-containing protein [Smithellaceae bacterium]HRS82528.1 DUF167 domain-containing protein [Smithellaceae bacterium]HRV45191.1 DUF167 domain-containing protein [Smithellaceae bacterium]